MCSILTNTTATESAHKQNETGDTSAHFAPIKRATKESEDEFFDKGRGEERHEEGSWLSRQ